MPRFIDLILPLAVPGTFTYRAPTGNEPVEPGMRVVVPFGSGGRLYTGLVVRCHDEAPAQRKLREALSVLDARPIVTMDQVALWERMAEHYLCTLGEVMIAALPGALLLSSTTRIVATATTAESSTRTPRLALLLDALEARGVLTTAEAGALLGVKDPLRAVQRLVEQGAVALEEEMRKPYAPKATPHVELTPEAASEEALHAWFDRLARAPKQLALLMKGIEMGRWLEGEPRPVPLPRLLKAAGASRASFDPLVDKGLFQLREGVAESPPAADPRIVLPELSAHQEQALGSIRTALKEHRCVLLQGVTGSGKTEVYSHLITEAIANEGQVLYLLPEIALTTQLVGRLRARFGARVTVFHSRLSPAQQAEVWHRMRSDPGSAPIVIGARSALFLPFTRPRLIIVDEEHDPSYKQHDPAPRYHARDMALVLATLHNAPVVLGSATPSMESMHNARTGKFGLAKLEERYGRSVLPEVRTVDLREARKRKRMRGHFTPELVEAIERTVARGDQVILFQNRRGYSPVWQCEQCGHVPGCDHCDVSLTYHKRDHTLRCHYCGRHYPPPSVCASCGSHRLRMLGLGTERIEEELANLLPTVRVARLDQDTARGKHALERLLTDFAEGAIDVLVGTQMVTKGLDMERVNTVGIMDADRLLRFPDLRAHERAFQLMAQVAGRSGRRDDPGLVLIQASEVAHPVLGFVLKHDVDGFYARESEHRQAHGYPPFSRLVRITLKHRDEARVAAAAEALLVLLRPQFGDRVLGPEVPAVAWVRDLHIRNVLVKIAKSRHGSEKDALARALEALRDDPEHGRMRIIVDVDPL